MLGLTEQLASGISMLSGLVEVTVDTNVMLAQAEQVSKSIDRMQSEFNDIGSLVEKTSGYWIGEAGDHHRKMFTDKKGDIEEILKRLKELPSDLRQIAAGYSDVESKVTTANQALRSDYI